MHEAFIYTYVILHNPDSQQPFRDKAEDALLEIIIGRDVYSSFKLEEDGEQPFRISIEDSLPADNHVA